MYSKRSLEKDCADLSSERSGEPPRSRPTTLSLDHEQSMSSNCNTPFLIKELFSPSNPFLKTLGNVSNLGNVILASPHSQNMTTEQIQVDKKFYEKYKEIRAQELNAEKEATVSNPESRIFIVSQNTLDQLNEVFTTSINNSVDQERKPFELSIDNDFVVSMATSSKSISNNRQYVLPAPSSVSSAEFPSSSNCLGNEENKNKIDKKRARNRDAARKCRERKLQLMKKLEKEVQDLVHQKEELENQAHNQKKKIENLRSVIIEHLNNGCAM